MSLLSIIQNVADEVGVSSPGTVIGNNTQNAKRMLRFASQSVKKLHRMHDWTVLQKEHTFNTASSDDEYDLPSDFARLIHDTTWDRASYLKYRGKLSPQQWQSIKSGLVQQAQITKGFRIKLDTADNNRRFFIDPTPDATEEQVFEYIIDTPIASSDKTTLYTDWNADTDISLIDEYLVELGVKWRTLRRLGLTYLDEKREFEQEARLAAARDGGTANAHITQSRFLISAVNVQEGDFNI